MLNVEMNPRIIVAFISCVIGLGLSTSCDKIFRRPPLEKSQFIQKFFPSLSKAKGIAIDYEYEAGVGGFGAIARIDVTPELMQGVLDDGIWSRINDRDGGEDDIALFVGRAKTTCKDDQLPEWFNVPNGEKYSCYKRSKDGGVSELFVRADLKRAYFCAIGQK